MNVSVSDPPARPWPCPLRLSLSLRLRNLFEVPVHGHAMGHVNVMGMAHAHDAVIGGLVLIY